MQTQNKSNKRFHTDEDQQNNGGRPLNHPVSPWKTVHTEQSKACTTRRSQVANATGQTKK